jgi:hypothetical protein
MSGTHAPAPALVRIRAYAIDGKERAFVLPPYFHVGKGDTKVPSVQWENKTKKDVKWWFPNGWKLFQLPQKKGNDDIRGISDNKDGFDHPLIIPPDKVLTLYVNNDSTDGMYEYHVYCDETEDSAKGNSEPWGGRP